MQYNGMFYNSNKRKEFANNLAKKKGIPKLPSPGNNPFRFFRLAKLVNSKFCNSIINENYNYCKFVHDDVVAKMG